MIKIRSRMRTRASSQGALVLEKKLFGRILNALIVLVLLAAVTIPLAGGEGINTGGAFLFLVVFILSLYNAGYNRQFSFSRPGGTFEFTQRFLGIRLKSFSCALTEIEHIQLTSVVFKTYMPRREDPGLYKLELVFAGFAELPGFVERRMLLEDSSDVSELLAAGKMISGFSALTFESDDKI